MANATIQDLKKLYQDGRLRLRQTPTGVILEFEGRPVVTVALETAERATMVARKTVKGLEAIEQMRRTVAARGLPNMTLREINAEIAAARRARKR